MEDTFLENEWRSLCERVGQTARHFGGEAHDAFGEDVELFVAQAVPRNYTELLERNRAAAAMALKWRDANSPADHAARQDQDAAKHD